jgi:hypothetical protein
MDDSSATTPLIRPGKATLRSGRIIEENGEDLIVPIRDPEAGGPSPAAKAMEIQAGPSIQPVLKAGPRTGLQRTFSRDGISWPCLNMSPRLQGLILLNLVRIVIALINFSKQ